LRSLSEIGLLSVYIPILISFLYEDSHLLHVKSARSLLHTEVLQRLLLVGKAYPNEFRTIVGQVPQFKLRLETAIRNQHQKPNKSSTASGTTTKQDPVRSESVPSIQLKTDFSNFTSSS
jgi:hypothetical protein